MLKNDSPENSKHPESTEEALNTVLELHQEGNDIRLEFALEDLKYSQKNRAIVNPIIEDDDLLNIEKEKCKNQDLILSDELDQLTDEEKDIVKQYQARELEKTAKYTLISVNLNKDTYLEGRRGQAHFVASTASHKGLYWMVKGENNDCYLVPNYNKIFNSRMMLTWAIIFEILHYEPEVTNANRFELKKPAKVLVITTNEEWVLAEDGQGILDFKEDLQNYENHRVNASNIDIIEPVLKVESESLASSENINNEENSQTDNLGLRDDPDPSDDQLLTDLEENQSLSNHLNVVKNPPEPLNNSDQQSNPISPKTRTSLPVKPVVLSSLIIILLGVIGVFLFPRIKNFLLPITLEKVVLYEEFINPSSSWSFPETAKIEDDELLQEISPSRSGNKTIWYTNYENDNIIKSDYSVEVRKLNQHDAAQYGVLGNVQEYEESAYYYLLINGNGYFMMGKESPEGRKNEIEWTKHDSIKLGTEVNQLRIVVENNVFTGFINGKKVGSFRDDSYPSGTIGLYTEADNSWKTEGIAFDNVSMKVTLTPFLGIEIRETHFDSQSLTPDLEALKEDLKDNKGVEIDKIYSNSPAEKAGLKVNDIIYKIDNQLMKNGEDVHTKIFKSSKIGQSVKITIIRNGKKENIRVKLDPYLIPKEKIW